MKATEELLVEGGLSAVTIEGIAARAGVGKPTIYRSWPNAHAVAMTALMETGNDHRSPATAATKVTDNTRRPETTQAIQVTTEPPRREFLSKVRDSPLGSLRAQLHEIARVFSAPLGRNIAMMIAAAEHDTELSKAFRNHFILARRSEGRDLLSDAGASGEIRSGFDIDIELALDLIYAPLFYRLLVDHAALSPQFIDGAFDIALQGLTAARPQSKIGGSRMNQPGGSADKR